MTDNFGYAAFDSYATVLEQNNKLDQAIEMEEKAILIAMLRSDALLETFKANLNSKKARSQVF